MTREELKEEAIKRLEIMKSQGLSPNVVRSFLKKDLVYMSEFNGFCGALFWFNDLGGAKHEWIKLVNEFEEEHDALVYHITHEVTSFGELLDLFFVSKYDEEWSRDKSDLYEKYSHVYVINLTIPEYSEFGGITYRALGGGLVRTDYMY